MGGVKGALRERPTPVLRTRRAGRALVFSCLFSVAMGCSHFAGPETDEKLEAQSARIAAQAVEIEKLREQVTLVQGQLSRTLAVLKAKFAREASYPIAKTSPSPNPPPRQKAQASTAPAGQPTARAQSASPSPGPATEEATEDAYAMPDAREESAAQREAELVEAIPVRAGGVLLPKGRLQLEPHVRYAFSSVNRVEITGYTILPALTLGVIDVTRRDSSSITTLMSARYGLTDRIELDVGIPFIAGWSSFGLSPKNTDASRAGNLDASGYDIGDLRAGVRYQLNKGGGSVPSFVAGVGARFPTGTSPYEVARYGSADQYLEREIPTGSGFYAVTPTLSFVYPSEPSVLFGNVRYTWNIPREVDSLQPGSRPPTPYGEIDPGDVIGVGLGLGLSLNDKLSVSLSYDHSVVLGTTQNGQDVSESSPLQIGTLGLGATWRASPRMSYNLMVGIGVTDDAPDVSVGVRIPTTFDLFGD